jgi:hypothetical protein
MSGNTGIYVKRNEPSQGNRSSESGETPKVGSTDDGPGLHLRSKDQGRYALQADHDLQQRLMQISRRTVDGTQDRGRKETISYERVQTSNYTNPMNRLERLRLKTFLLNFQPPIGTCRYETPQKIVDLYKRPTRFDYRRFYVPGGIAQVQEKVFGGSIGP